MSSQPADVTPTDAKRAVLEELVYETVRQYARLWKTTQYAQALVEHIETTKAECADTREEQDRLVDEYTDRAWSRLASLEVRPHA